MAKITFSLYLAKRDAADFDGLLTENARAMLESGRAQKTDSSK
jgi:hypothetical protein